MKISRRVAWQVLDGEAVLIDLDQGRSIGLNAAGSFLWQRAEHEAPAELAASLAQRFGLDAERARGDVDAFLALMAARGYLQP